MSNNTVRIRTTPNGNDKYLKIKLEQEFDFIEVLSLKISQEDAYRNFCSDYGVVTGRVIINSGFGVPNARVSIFLPIEEVDKNNPEIKGLYPYEVVLDKDINGVRYNLLPKNSETDNECFTPIGTFPNKREILDNPEMLDIYQKYYKFTTTTNYAGDFMIFGVPVGNHTVHVDADISDMGIASQRPYDSITQGTPKKFFESSTKFKGGTNLDKLVQVKTANIGVNVQPFWGDMGSCEVGITRVDLDLNYTITPSAIFMGSIFGDNDKSSVNKNCYPRRKMGTLCSQVANEGTVEMIRKTTDGTIEKFDVEGGRVIDENGAWAYQIPMNLDYMITDEFGDLILSEDQTKGIPTRASVRFKVGMDQSGGEGRLRTRAKYLIPNNPSTKDEIDYSFDGSTKDSSFRELYWNKIYTVSNYVSRFQTKSSISGRRITGIKDVDDCVGDKNPFPFNKVNTSFSPIFFIICLIIQIIGFIIYIINSLLLPLINIIIKVINILLKGWNSIMKAFCNVSRKRILRVRIFGFLKFTCKLIITLIKPVPCIYVECDEKIYAPGCGGSAKDRLRDEKGISNVCPSKNNMIDLCGLPDCIAFQMAKALNLFQFDFYNDWVNGSLYAFLLKYKKRRKKSERFCEYDCSYFGIAAGGVDGNGNGVPDNKCHSNFLADSCFNGGGDSQNEGKSLMLREGLIKKVGDEFYYAATSHDGGLKMFATEIVTLGSVFKCDWQGVPKVNQYLIPTSYKVPPETDELDGRVVLETGQVQIGKEGIGLFFNIDCIGVHSNFRQCLNMGHICEIGVEIDEDRTADGGGVADGVIGVSELDGDGGGRPKFFRDVFLGLNTEKDNWNLNYPFTSNFNLNNQGSYDFADKTTQNGGDYVDFRGYSLGGTPRTGNSFGQFENSFFFYFGILPGKTALDKMNQNFFITCENKVDNEFNVQVITTPLTVSGSTDGTVIFTFIGGDAPFEYTISGPNGYTNTGTCGENNTPPTVYVNGLGFGTYIITANDSYGSPVVQNFNIDNPPALYAVAVVSQDCTIASVANGEITISVVGGGSGVYNYTLYNSSCSIVTGPTSFTNSTVISNLAVDIATNTCFGATLSGEGYTLIISDSDLNTVYITDLVVNGATPLTLDIEKTDVLCANQLDGTISITTIGGQEPISISATTMNGFYDTGFSHIGLSADTYEIIAVDSIGTTANATVTINTLNPPLEIEALGDDILSKQCDPNNYYLKFKVKSVWASSTVYLDYAVDEEEDSEGGQIWYPLTVTGYVDNTTILELVIPKNQFSIRYYLRMANAARTCYSESIQFDADVLRLPPNVLTINTNSPMIDNNELQTSNALVKFKVNVSHLMDGHFLRLPYTVEYSVFGILGVEYQGLSQPSTTIVTNQQQLIGVVPLVNDLPPTSCLVKIRITDNKGCQSNMLTIPINLPL